MNMKTLLAAGRTISTLTTVDMQWSREKRRWLSALEKLAAMGFPANAAIAAVYRQDCLLAEGYVGACDPWFYDQHLTWNMSMH